MSSVDDKDSKPSQYICYCNKVTKDRVAQVIHLGASNLAEIYDACSAGSGPCGGSCRKKILELLSEEKNATAPENTPAQAPKKSEIPDKFVEAISLFNRRYYWETHEVLEDLWMEEHGERKLFYQGLIQAAAALYHVLNANPRGVIKLAAEAARKLSQYKPVYMEVPLDELIASMETYVNQSKEIMGHEKPGFDYDLLPYLRLGNVMERTRPQT